MLVFYFFFFKQKTAYELRSSDWSSDVCSSDLPHQRHRHRAHRRRRILRAGGQCPHPFGGLLHARESRDDAPDVPRTLRPRRGARGRRLSDQPLEIRSEEHTSELQSLLRISYAVFCLKNKKHTNKP